MRRMRKGLPFHWIRRGPQQSSFRRASPPRATKSAHSMDGSNSSRHKARGSGMASTHRKPLRQTCRPSATRLGSRSIMPSGDFGLPMRRPAREDPGRIRSSIPAVSGIQMKEPPATSRTTLTRTRTESSRLTSPATSRPRGATMFPAIGSGSGIGFLALSDAQFGQIEVHTAIERGGSYAHGLLFVDGALHRVGSLLG